MAKITTKKEPIALIGDPQPQYINFGVGDGIVAMAVKGDGVIHSCALDPNEAVQMGVMLIQMAAAASAQRQQQAVAIPPPLRNIRG